MTLLAYQRAIVADPSPWVSVVAARRTGKTEAVCARAALGLLGYVVGPNGELTRCKPRPQILAAHREDSARELLARVHRHALAIAANELGRVPPVPGRMTSFTTSDGTPCVALPDSPRAFRGLEGDVTIDELPFLADPRQTLEAAMPSAGQSLSAPDGYRVTVSGTPWPGIFARAVMDSEGDLDGRFAHFSRHQISLRTAAEAGFPKAMSPVELDAFIEQRRRELGADAYAREMDLSWAGMQGSVFSTELLNRARLDIGSVIPKGPRFLGIDVARSGAHLTAIVEVVRAGDVAYVCSVETLQGQSFMAQAARIASLSQGCAGIVLDSTGLGVGLLDVLRSPLGIPEGGAPVEPVVFTNAIKAELIRVTLGALESGKLKLCADRDLHADFASIQATALAGGSTRFDGESEAGGHADRAWAAMLAIRRALSRSAGLSRGDLAAAELSPVQRWAASARGASRLNYGR